MIDTALKIKALKKLTEIAGDASQKALEKEFVNIDNNLQQHTSYNDLNTQLEFLDIICYRVPERTINILRGFLERLKTLTLSVNENEYVSEYYTIERLIIETLEIITNLRYIQTKDVIDILFEYTNHIDNDVAKKSKEGIERLVKYNIRVFKNISITPQQDFLKKIQRFSDAECQQYFDILVTACGHILSEEMEDTESHYNSLIIKRANVPTDKKHIQKLRLDVVNYLKKLYKLADDTDKKEKINSAIGKLSRSPQPIDIIIVLEWYKKIINSEMDMDVLQSIENSSYWINYHRPEQNKDILTLALEIRDMLYTHSEYKIFRILIGFNAVFDDWEKIKIYNDDFSFDNEEKPRDLAMNKLVESVTQDNLTEWQNRIFDYCSIQSNDAATFPYFCKFLRLISEQHPIFALDLLKNHTDKIKSFIPAILNGIFDSPEKEVMIALIKEWSHKGEYLPHILHFLKFSTPTLHADIMKIILREAVIKNDSVALSQIISVVTKHYTQNNQPLVNDFFIPALEALSKQSKNSWYWIYDFWYQTNKTKILEDMNDTDYEKILENLVSCPRVDYHLENILLPIAEKSPEMVIDFFVKRFKYKEQNSAIDTDYEVLSFDGIGKLSKPLSVNSTLVLQKAFATYDDKKYWDFQNYGGKLIHHIFPNFSENLEKALIEYIHKDKFYWQPIIIFLKTYNGETFIHNVCKELIKVVQDDEILTDIMIALWSEGVTHGEYGRAESYERKVQELEPWLNDADVKIRNFAKEYIDSTSKQATAERKRVDERIILSKHEYGIDITNE